jgi:uncharacterized SAM-binding protein YcdF (DUF218 family)
MYEVAKVAGYLLSPLTFAMTLWLLAGACRLLGSRRASLWLAVVAFVGLWAGSMPVIAIALDTSLETKYPAVVAQAMPKGDAIVVLGGALAVADPRQGTPFILGPSAGRIWHAASLYKAGKAPWVVVAAGSQQKNEGLPSEADAIADMLVSLGVPAASIQKETASRNTLENAQNVRPILDRLRAHKILLVTSAQHMPRAVSTFTKVWMHSELEILPAPADGNRIEERNSGDMWIPSPTALLRVTKALKEYAGMVALAIM